MASIPSFSTAMILVLATILLFVSPACSANKEGANHHTEAHNGFRLSLKHVDSGKNLSRFERLQHAMKRGRQRVKRFSAMVLAEKSDSKVKSPVHAGNGEFLMDLSIGTPPKPYTAIMDTGSDLIWTQCKPCKDCFDQSTPVFDPTTSSSFANVSCTDKLCKALPRSRCSDGCEYLYTYGDSSLTQGFMATETFTFDKVSVPSIGFGCGLDNEGSGFSQGAGLVGLGRGPLSLVSQLKEPKFSYCLTSISDTITSTLLMGSLASVNSTDGAIITTPLIKNPSHPSFYYLTLQGITVGATLLPIEKSTFALSDDGSGGLIIDSGTTITYLEESGFDIVKKEFISQVKLPVADSSTTGLELCFNLPSDTSSITVPSLIFHFDGADLQLPGENYMVVDSSMGVLCLAMGSSNGMSIFGNIQQQNMLVLHDLEKEKLSFIPTKCSQM
ncbi:aspartic proteinase nepenthesin-1 [Cornus florida]|uniref:aspartic proteinase nepenthesin-1 n=1 Tax=Cornus florida TaxID=4283 RepID=UPI00289C2187|nr:aspartic proteinase nepenthesin-1 [Cornus florida]